MKKKTKLGLSNYSYRKFYNELEDKILYNKRSILFKYGGPSSALIFLVLIEILRLRGINAWGMFSVFLVIVIFTVFFSGFLPGIAISTLISIYCIYYIGFPIRGNLSNLYKDNVYFHIISNCLSLYIISIVVGVISKKFKRNMRELLIEHAQLMNVERMSNIIKVHLSFDGRMVEISNKLYSVIGYTEEELKSMCIKDITIKDDWEKDEECFKKLISGEVVSVEMDKRYISKDGEIIWMFVQRSIKLGKDGEPVGILSYMHDITERKRAEEALRESEQRYRQFVEMMPDAVIVHKNKKIVYCNSQCKRYFGGSDNSWLIGKDVMDFTHEDYKEKVEDRIHMVQQLEQTPKTIEEKLIGPSGEILDVEVSAAPFLYEGEIASIVVIRDIRERKKAEINERLLNEAIEYDKIKTEFFSNLSHELRTPLNVLLGSLQLLDMYSNKNQTTGYSYSTIELSKHTKVMKQNCYRLLRLVNNLIDITKIDTGYFQLSLKNRDMINTVENITLSVADYVESRGIELIFDTEIEEKIMAFDTDKIERIILNLLSNAIKFTESGGKITVDIMDLNNQIKISVKDTGIGIEKDKQSIIFERFRQVDKSFTRSHEGSGIGLSIVKSLVEMHNGSISVKSEYGVGTEFIVTLPVELIGEAEEKDDNFISNNSNVERIRIEFSDIYA